MTAATATKSFKLMTKGLPFSEATTGLKPNVSAALRKLGVSTVTVALGLLESDPKLFAELVGQTGPEFYAFQSAIATAAGGDALQAGEKKELLELPCSMGFDIEKLSTVDTTFGDTEEILLTLDGFQTPALDMPGIDLSDELPPIRDQGLRGTCVAHAMVRCYEHIEFKTAGSPKPNTLDYSEQFTYWYTKQKDGQLNVEGTWIQYAADEIVNLGTSTESVCAYQPGRYPDVDVCQRGPQPSQAAYNEARTHRANTARRVNPKDIDALMTVLTSGKAVAYAIPVFRSWHFSPETRASGYLTMPLGMNDAIVGGHAITLTGWGRDTDVPGGGYFIFDNSWSTAWGKYNQFGPGRGILPFKYAQLFGKEAFFVTM